MIRWMTGHPVAANLVMALVIAFGVLSAVTIPQKTFPEFSLDVVDVTVEYPGASPAEIEQSVIRPIEDQLSGIDGVDEVSATAREGRGQVSVTFLLGEDIQKKLDEVKTEIDRIDSFPLDAEEPTVVQRSNRSRVLEIVLHGEAPERTLKEEAERLKAELTALPQISFVEVANVRDYEISVEIDRDTLTAYGLTLGEVARIVGANSMELPGGAIDTPTVSIPIRTMGRNYDRRDFENIVVIAGEDGAAVRLGDVATVIDGFEDSDLAARFGGAPAASVNVFRVGDEQVLEVVAASRAHLHDSFAPSLPEGIEATIWRNDAEELQNRLDLLVENAILGLALVVVCLALFLDFRLAFWSAAGMGVAFAGAFGVMALAGMSINMISLFGFILAIGIVVDNAIVVSENIFKNGEAGARPLDAAIRGAQRVAVPVIFSTLTTVVAFTPLLQMPGTLGKFLGDIPTVVMIVLTLSLFQALLILPRNLARLDVSADYRPNIVLRLLGAVRRVFDAGLRWVIERPLDAMLRFNTRRTAPALALVAALMILTAGVLVHGYVKFSFFPSIDGKYVTANLEMTDGAAFARTRAVAGRIRAAAERAGEGLAAALPEGAGPVIENISVVVGQSAAGGGPSARQATPGATLATIVVQVQDPETRDWPTADFEAAWLEEIGEIAGVKKLTVTSAVVSPGDAVALEMSLPDGRDIGPVIDAARAALEAIPGVYSIRDDRSAGRLEYKLALKPEARLYGLSLQDLALQMRDGFFGAEATRVQRGRDDLKVFVRLPADQRSSVADMLDTRIRTPAGALIPLSAVAEIREGLSPSEILRRNGRTITTLTADVDIAVITSGEANAYIRDEVLPPLMAAHEGLKVSFGGEQRTQGDAQAALGQALALALFVIFALLALVFRSYLKPLVVMAAIPLGLIGAVAGHLLMGVPLTLLSIFGIIGLAGVIINNSLVMIDLYNEYLARGWDVRRAVIEGTKDRFRPILLTSLTTFLGVFPLIMETSLQAQFLIPLALSIGFGVLVGTAITIIAVPSIFILQARLTGLFGMGDMAEAPGDPAPPAEKAAPVRLHAAE